MDLGTLLSGPIGALLGAGGAIVQKVLDFKDAKDRRAHELAMRDKDREQLQLELANKSEIAKVEADTAIAVREFDAVAASIGADKAAYGESITGRITDMARGLVRPVITLLATGLIGWMTYRVLSEGGALPTEERVGLLRESLFIAGTSIAWWFGARGSRPGKR